uniref:Uncharacterized protein n=1 Tax=Anguilla anguilla TaxID=7936 RepID=A0A0E9UNW5_ANGAN
MSEGITGPTCCTAD